MKTLFQWIFKLLGWKVVGEVPKVDKLVMIAAPHTSNWDFFYARAAFFIMGLPLRYTIKKELFFFPLGPILKSLGGIPIDRSTKGGMVSKMTQLYTDYDKMVLMITPEGTRSYSPEWKKGFYHISNNAQIPISLGYLDYGKKHAGIGPLVYPTGDYEADLKVIQDFYKGIEAKFPEKGVR